MRIHNQFLAGTALPNTSADELIYDNVYQSAAKKHKFSNDPKYTYFNALMRMREKLYPQTSVYSNIFTPLVNPQGRSTHYPSIRQSENGNNGGSPIYHIQRINKLKFKIYKDRPVNDGHRVANSPHDGLGVSDVRFRRDTRTVGDQAGLRNILEEYKRLNVTNSRGMRRGKEGWTERSRSLLR